MIRKFEFSPRRSLVAISPVLMLLCLALAAGSIYDFLRLNNLADENRKASYIADTQAAANALDKTLVSVERQAEALAAAIGDGSLARENYKQTLAKMLQRDPAFYGGGIAFMPYEYDAQRRLYAPYFAKKGDTLEFMQIEDVYDYTDASQAWFGEAIASGSRWSAPYFDKSLGDILMTTYSAVVYRDDASGDRQPIGVVTIDISIESMGDAVKGFGLGSNGYLEIVSAEGVYLYSPTLSRVLNQDSIFDSTQWVQDKAFDKLHTLITDNENGLVKLHHVARDKHEWISATSLPTTPWHVVGVFAEPLEELHSPALRHRLMFIILGLVLFLSIVLLYKQVVPPAAGAIISWPSAILVTLVLVIGVGQIWRVTMQFASDSNRQVFPIVSQQAVDRLVEEYEQRAAKHLTAPPVVIPTGLYIESMKFLDNSDLQLVGGVWQKYNIDRDRGVERGVTFPGAAKLRVEEPVVLTIGDYELVRWQFSGDWRFKHQFARFPLLKDDFGIGILPRDKASNIMLVPDVESFPYLGSSQLPGLSPNVFLLGWRITDSSFELRPWQHNTTFGRPATLKNQALPEWYLSIGMEKVFVNSVISNLTPLAIAMTIAFMVLLISTRDLARLDILRTGVGFDLGICTSIFFVVALSHIGLRSNIISDEIFYLEYFYMLMYLNLIWVCCHSILSGFNAPSLEKWTFGVSAKKAFFPLNFLVIFIFTWLTFYS